MDNPIFTLHGVVKAKGENTDFVGPLALILQLLSKNKIEIKDISISLILDQYLAYLDSLSKMDLEVASEFVAMASYLVYIKTKTLLSGEENVEELSELISSLEDLRRRENYAQIKAVTVLLADMFRNGSGLMVKMPEYITPDNDYKFTHSVEELTAALSQVINREELSCPSAEEVAFPKPIAYSVTEKASEILGCIRSRGALRIDELISDAKSRSEVVAVFIAVLELCRTGVIYLLGCDQELSLCSSRSDAINNGLPNFEEMEEN